MSGRKGVHSRSSLIGSRRPAKKGAAGRRELEDPVTQVSALQGTDEGSGHSPENLQSGSPQKGRYISQLSLSPSPPSLGKLKKLGQKGYKTAVDIPPTEGESLPTPEEGSADVNAPANEERQEEDQVQEGEENKKSPSKFDSISSFLQELARQVQSCGPLPKCPRQTSKRACRFELPMDVTDLENMTAVEYLSSYCIVAPTKEQSYQKTFTKHCKMHIEDALRTEHLQSALEDHFSCSFIHGEVTTLLEYLDWEPGTYIQDKTFVVMSAFFERILCQLDRSEDSVNSNRKDELEVADFSGLEEKLEGVSLNDSLKALLSFIHNT